jgi:hypothetical protein
MRSASGITLVAWKWIFQLTLYSAASFKWRPLNVGGLAGWGIYARGWFGGGEEARRFSRIGRPGISIRRAYISPASSAYRALMPSSIRL